MIKINHLLTFLYFMIDWTEKYRPTRLDKIVGNTKSIKRLLQWSYDWQKGVPVKKAVILSGKPGIGKTTTAYSLAQTHHWTTIELNTSDARNATTIKAVATAGATHQTFQIDGTYSSTKDGGRKLIILDEADNLYEKKAGSSYQESDLSDRGGKQAIIQTIKNTQQPIILIVNDYYQLIKGSGSILKQLCLHIPFYPPYPNEIQVYLQSLCIKEKITVDRAVLQHLVQRCNGDIRSAVHDLQTITLDQSHIRLEDTKSLGSRDQTEVIFDLLKKIFHTKDFSTIQTMKQHIQEDPQLLIQWVAENLYSSYTTSDDLYKGYESLSLADLYLGRVFRRNNYQFWSYASELMTLGVSSAKQHPVRSTKYQFPTWLKSRKQRKNDVKDKYQIQSLIGSYTHCSKHKASNDIIPYINEIISHHPEIVSTLKNQLSKDALATGFFNENASKEKKDESHTTKKVILSHDEQLKEEKESKKKQQKTLFL